MFNSIFTTNEDEPIIRQIKRNMHWKDVVEYAYATAYFDINVLNDYWEVIKEIIEKQEAVVKFIISNQISKQEFLTISTALNHEWKKYLSTLINSRFNLNQKKSLFDWIVNEKISFKIAFCEKGIFHYKLGYLKYKDSSLCEWQGSANHTTKGLLGYNSEQINFSWKNENEYSKIYETFNMIWENKSPKISVFDASLFLYQELLFDFKNSHEVIKILSKKYEAGLFKLDNHIYYFQSKKIVPYLLPSANWEVKENGYHIAKVEKNSFSKINMLNWIKNKEKVFVSQKLIYFLKDNISKMLQDVRLGKQMHENWSEVEKSLEYNNFKKCASNLNRLPYNLQIRQAFFASKIKKSLNFSVPGTGKSMVALIAFNFLKIKYNLKTLFIIGPSSSHPVWEEEFYLTFNKKPKILNLSEIKINFDRKYKYIHNINFSNFDIVIMHFQTASKYFEVLKNKINSNIYFIVDEAHYIKNWNGKWGSSISKIGQSSKYSLLLTGTPAPNGIKDIYNILSITYGENFMHHFIESSNKNEIISALHMKITYEDLGIPYQQIDHIVEYQFNNEQLKKLDFYNKKLSNSDDDNILKIIVKKMQLSTSLRLLENKNFGINDSPKMKKLINLIKPDSNIVIWANFIKTIDSLEENLKLLFPNVKIYKHYGKESFLERYTQIENYKKYGGILIANPQTLSEAVSLHKNTNYTIYFEYNYNLVHWQQSRNRTFRYGIDKNMHYYILTSKSDKIDWNILNALRNKAQFQRELISNNNDFLYETVIYEIRKYINRMG